MSRTKGERTGNTTISTDGSTAAVVAHGLLTRLAAVAGTAAVLRDGWGQLDDQDRAALLDRIEANAVQVGACLRGLVTGRLELPA